MAAIRSGCRHWRQYARRFSRHRSPLCWPRQDADRTERIAVARAAAWFSACPGAGTAERECQPALFASPKPGAAFGIFGIGVDAMTMQADGDFGGNWRGQLIATAGRTRSQALCAGQFRRSSRGPARSLSRNATGTENREPPDHCRIVRSGRPPAAANRYQPFCRHRPFSGAQDEHWYVRRSGAEPRQYHVGWGATVSI